MALPAPDLDDRRFQDLVDDAKRMVMRHCPEWTDHNVSDPGVTLIETFAYLTDQLLFRLNRVPDRLYLKFLDLLGLRLLPPVPAAVDVTFWLSAPAASPLRIPAGTAAATVRTETEESIVFTSTEELAVVAVSLAHLRTKAAGDGPAEDHTEKIRVGGSFPAFQPRPVPDDVLYVGLSDPAPRCAVRLDFRGRLDGVGVDPDWPPLVWEAWNGSDWVECEVSSDGTGGLNKPGAIVAHLPVGHEASLVDGVRAGWLRARITAPEPDQPVYSSSPVVDGLSACVIGGTVPAIHADIISNEPLGVAEGVAGQRFALARTPVLTAGVAPRIQVGVGDEEWQDWELVDTFADSLPDSRHYLLDPTTGTVTFGPTVRLSDGSMRQYGAVPAADAVIRARRYCVGGGARGNVPAGAIRTLKSSIPFVAGVTNLRRAVGGTDGETVEQAKVRAPVLLRTRSRAVTAEDYEILAREAAPEVARLRCLTAGEDGVEPGAVRVLVVPNAPQEDGRVVLGTLVPTEQTLHRISERLDQVRLIGTRVTVEPPRYLGVTVVGRLVARPRVSVAKVQAAALNALYALLNPLTGGPDGRGWPFGRAVHAGEVFATLQNVVGVEVVEDVRIFGANPLTGERGAQTTRLEVPAAGLVFSYQHQIRVEQR
jgi:predicted phage baseplate assembly protein